MHLACPRSLSALFALALAACGDDGPSLPGLDEGGGDDEASGSEDGGDDPSSATGAADGTGGALGAVARVRVVNLVPGTSFDVWGADVDHAPVRIASGLGFATISDYIDTPINTFSGDPELVLMPPGEAPDDVPSWEIDNSSGGDRAFISVSELDGEGEQATIIVTKESANLQYEQLDETEIMAGDPGAAALHVAFRLFDLGGTVVPAFGVVGQPCLFSGSTGVPQPWSVAPGTFDVGVYDLQTETECTTPLVTASITAAADEHKLVVVYHEGDEIGLLSAAIPG